MLVKDSHLKTCDEFLILKRLALPEFYWILLFRAEVFISHHTTLGYYIGPVSSTSMFFKKTSVKTNTYCSVSIILSYTGLLLSLLAPVVLSIVCLLGFVSVEPIPSLSIRLMVAPIVSAMCGWFNYTIMLTYRVLK